MEIDGRQSEGVQVPGRARGTRRAHTGQERGKPRIVETAAVQGGRRCDRGNRGRRRTGARAEHGRRDRHHPARECLHHAPIPTPGIQPRALAGRALRCDDAQMTKPSACRRSGKHQVDRRAGSGLAPQPRAPTVALHDGLDHRQTQTRVGPGARRVHAVEALEDAGDVL